MFKILHNKTPRSLSNKFLKVSFSHSRPTRTSTKGDLLSIPRCGSSKTQKSINYQGVKI